MQTGVRKNISCVRVCLSVVTCVEEMRHRFESLLEVAKYHEESEDDESLETALLAASARKHNYWRTEEEGSDNMSKIGGA